MKTVLLAGGRGTRLAEETSVRPKPMVDIGGKPMLWHIMKTYAHFGFEDFVVASGFKSELIKEYFLNFNLHNNDYLVHLHDGTRWLLNEGSIRWRVAVIDTGLDTLTGGRLLRLKKWLNDGTFMATYGDGVGDIDIRRLVEFHRSHGRLATITAVRPPARFGALEMEGPQVVRFAEKPAHEFGWINGGFFVFEPRVLEYLHDDQTTLEREPLERLAADGQLMAWKHEGFWQPMDTIRDRQLLEELWSSGAAPWKVWEDAPNRMSAGMSA